MCSNSTARGWFDKEVTDCWYLGDAVAVPAAACGRVVLVAADDANIALI